jgi:glutathione S-transferase
VPSHDAADHVSERERNPEGCEWVLRDERDELIVRTFDLTNHTDGGMTIGPPVRCFGSARFFDHRGIDEQRAGQDEWASAARWLGLSRQTFALSSLLGGAMSAAMARTITNGRIVLHTHVIMEVRQRRRDTMKLYHSSRTRSGRARWALEELGVAHEVSRISFATGDHKKPEYLAIHPHGSVPALVDGDLTLTESSAIVLHLADKYSEKNLAPALGTNERAAYYRWIVYVPATLDPALETITMHTMFLPADKRSPAAVDAAKAKWENIAKVLEAAVDGRTYIVGDSFSAADIILGSALGWAQVLRILDGHPKLEAYLQNLQQRPGYQKAYAD